MNKGIFLYTLFASSMFWTCPEHLFSEMRQPQNQSHFQHTLSNLETELSYLKQRLDNQENAMESLRADVQQVLKQTKENSTKSVESQDARIHKIEKNIEKILADLKQFKAHSNELSETLGTAQKSQHTQSLESRQHIDIVHEKVKDLEAALKAITKAMQAKIAASKENISAPCASSCTYRVKPGDSLGKIAKELKVSTRELKELNGLSSDKITPGQDLKIP